MLGWTKFLFLYVKLILRCTKSQLTSSLFFSSRHLLLNILCTFQAIRLHPDAAGVPVVWTEELQ